MPIGVMPKIPSVSWSPVCSRWFIRRKAGALKIVSVVPSEAASDIGIRSREGERFCTRASRIMIGSIMAVIMRWCENAASAATAGITTRIARHSLEPAARAMPAPMRSVRPVSVSAAEMMNTEATMMAGSLANPESDSLGVRMPVAASASSVSIAAMSMRIFSLMKRISVTATIARKMICSCVMGGPGAILRGRGNPVLSASMNRFLAALLGAIVTGCAANPPAPAEPPGSDRRPPPAGRAPYSSTYVAPASPATLIRNATILTGTGTRIDGGDVLIEGGRIKAVGQSLTAPDGAVVIDASGRWVTPGLIDVHSHLGVYASPGVEAQNDGNEATDPVTSNVWAEHSVWPQDPGLEVALQGGVTSLQILPGSANLIGGRGVTIKNVPATTYQAMKFPGAPQGLKMACGENPKRVYGDDGRFPSTRMGNVAGYRQAFADAKDYMEDWKEYDAKLAKYERARRRRATRTRSRRSRRSRTSSSRRSPR